MLENSETIEQKGNRLQIDNNAVDSHFLKTNTSGFYVSSFVNIKSSNLFFTICQLIRNYSGIIIMIFIFFHLKTIFKFLKKDFSFNSNLVNRVKWVGLLFITWESLYLITSYIFGNYYSHIGLENFFKYSNVMRLNINPRLEFDFTKLLIGLSLLILSKLLKKGKEMQEENNLTI